MDIITKEDFFSNLQHYHILSPQQQKNAARLIDISKEFGSDESYKFVNAVLDSIRKKLQGSRVQ